MESQNAGAMIIGCVFLILLIMALSAAGGWVFMVFWNWLFVYLFHFPTINFWMGWGMVVFLGFIGNLLFKSCNNSSK